MGSTRGTHCRELAAQIVIGRNLYTYSPRGPPQRAAGYVRPLAIDKNHIIDYTCLTSEYTEAAMPKLKRGTESKSELVTVRMHPKLRFGLELIERAGSISTTEAVSNAIKQMLRSLQIVTATPEGVSKKQLEDVAELTWTKDEIGRFLNIASICPTLLLEHEHALLQTIISDPQLRSEGDDGIELAGVRISEPRLRASWESLT